MTQVTIDSSSPKTRLLSLDFFRGFTMFLLIGEFTGLFSTLTNSTLEGTFIHQIGMQFHHASWQGLRFWDLIQPFFMFIVGVAIPFSVQNRLSKGDSTKNINKHAIQRSLLLLFFGWALYCISAGSIVFRFQNVLAQLAFTYLLAFLIIRKSISVQLIISFGLLVITELIYRFFWLEGFNHPFVPNENFGTWLDLQYQGADLNGHWVSFNAIPTAAHTIWGVLAGKLLLSKKSVTYKLKALIIAGIIGVALGYLLDPFTPIIKRISTSSFVLVSGGWSLLVLAFSYWLIDIKMSRKWVLFFAVVGMNPLFIYLFAHLQGTILLNDMVLPFSNALFGFTGELGAMILLNFLVWFLLWYICYWFYRKKIFIKI